MENHKGHISNDIHNNTFNLQNKLIGYNLQFLKHSSTYILIHIIVIIHIL